MKKKIKIGLIFGGRSSEHEVSLVSARSIYQALDKKKYDIFLIGIKKDGYWVKESSAKELLQGKKIKEKGEFIPVFLKNIDVFFPVLHGSFGEDGTIQGFFEILNKPYVGAGVLGSALGIDKIMQKIIWQYYHIPVVKFIWFSKKEWLENKNNFINKIEKNIKYPCFIKPANTGSSIGISKAFKKIDLIKAVNLAFKYDFKVLIETAVKNPKEIEVSVLGNEEPRASLPGQVIPSNEFYDYEAKYVNNKSTIIIPAKLSQKTTKKIQKIALKAYQAVEGQGMARVDFLLSKDKIYVNEVNTIPGFTSISMYPKLWQASGLSSSKLLDKLIVLAVKTFKQKQKFQYSWKLKEKWYVS